MQHVTIFTSMTFLSKIAKFWLVPLYKCRCRILCKGLILGIFKSLARLQNIWDGDKNVCPKVFEQLVTTSWRQSMVSTFNKPKFQNALSSTTWLFVGIQGGKNNKWLNPRKELVKKCFWRKGQSIRNTYIFLQQRDVVAGGACQ